MKNWLFFLMLIPGTTFAQTLRLVAPTESTLRDPVTVLFELNGTHLHVQFKVKAKVINAKPHLGDQEFPYQRDVVEIFISVEGNSDSLPYYEFELSPLGQTFEVRVDDLRKPYATHLKMGVFYRVERSAEGWTGEMRIPLENLGWNGDLKNIVGNAFAIQGKAPNRSYWSLFTPPMKKPNFHRPEFFRPLISAAAQGAAAEPKD